MNTFTFREYQSKTNETAIYNENIEKLVEEIFPGPGKQQVIRLLKLCYVSLGLGEVGELQGKIKKIIRDNNGIVNDDKKKELAKELGDILWYVSETCSKLGLDMGEVAEGNLVKLASRKERGVLAGSGDER
jgi:NTP pyrophosphatase (non-canonical NTP hydrolase)